MRVSMPARCRRRPAHFFEIRIAREVFVNVRHAVLPKRRAPGFGGQIIFQDALIAVKRRHLAGFFLQRHLRNQIVNALFNRLGRVLINILFAVLVQVGPAVVINVLARDDGFCRMKTFLVTRRIT